MTDEELLAQADSMEDEFRHRAANHSDFRYDKSQDAYWDLGSFALLKPKAVNASIPADLWETTGGDDPRPIAPANTIANIDTGLVVECATWWPGRPRFIRNEVVGANGSIPLAGATTLNTYRAPDKSLLKEQSNGKTHEHWLAHVKKLYPDPKEHEHFLDFMAHGLQKPSVKPQHGILLAGQQGIGKDAMLLPLRRGVGPGNAASIDPDDLFDSFNPWAKSVLLVIDEVRPHPNAGRASDFYNKCKVLCANAGDMMPVNIKHVSTFYVPNVLRVFFTANEPKSMYIPPEDRRIFVMTSMLPDPKVNDVFEEDYFDDLFGYFNSGGWQAVALWLMERDISGFKHGKAPPQTHGKLSIIESAKASRRSIADDILEQFVDKGCGGISPDVIFPTDLISFIQSKQGLFDDYDAARKAIVARNFHYKMDEFGYDLLRNPNANRWKRKGFESRVSFVKKGIAIEDRVKTVQSALTDRPLAFNVEKGQFDDGRPREDFTSSQRGDKF